MGVCGGTFRSWRVFGWQRNFAIGRSLLDFIAGQMLPFLAGWGMPGHNGTGPSISPVRPLFDRRGAGDIWYRAYCFGLGLLQREPWARVLGLVLGILALLAAIWTALGLHALGALA